MRKTLLLGILFLNLCSLDSTLFAQCDNVGMHFDGVNDRVHVTNMPLLNEFTFSAWFKSPTSGQTLDEDRIFATYIQGGSRFEVGIESESPNIGKLWVYDSSASTGAPYVFNTPSLYDDQWHKVVVTNDGNKRSIFLDGQYLDSWFTVSTTYGVNFYIGSWVGSNGNFLGEIDEVAVYDIALDSTDIVNDNNCVLFGNEPNIIGYYPLANGMPGANNIAVMTTPNLAGGMGDGQLLNFALTGSTSNFVCSDNTGIDLTCQNLAECQTDSLVINSGWDSINETVFAPGAMQGFWILQNAPTNSGAVTIDAPTWNINRHPAWAPPGYNSTYISPFPEPGMNESNISTSFDPYTLRRCFCVEDDNSQLSFDIDIHVDNQMQMYLYNDATGARTFLDEVTNGSSTANFKGTPEHLNIAPVTIATAGTYCLDADLRNDHGGSPLGINITGVVYGATMLEDSCCAETAYISGYKFIDTDCDGSVALGDPREPGYTIQLYEAGSLINSTTTDANGFYSFAVSPGTYDVKEVLQADWEYSVPATGEYTGITVAAYDAYEANFGNIYTGPIETDDFETSCLSPGDELVFSWTGQACDCDITLLYAECGTGAYSPIVDLNNTGSFTWTIPAELMGDYEFIIEDCDGNSIAFANCITIDDYAIHISAIPTACGVYDFAATFENIAVSDIVSYTWNFDALGGSTQAADSFTFDDAGTYDIKLTIETNTGCIISEILQLEVTDGANDPDCEYCPPNVLGEIEDGDLYIHNSCYGVILQSPNGNCFRLTVSDEGIVKVTQVNCQPIDTNSQN